MKTSQEYVAEIRHQITEVSVEALKQCMLKEEVVLIDVREHEEFVTGHIQSAVNFPRGVLEMKLQEHPKVSHHCETRVALDALSQQDIYLICRTGGRSALAAKSLLEMGFSRVKSVAGGMIAWKESAMPLAEQAAG